ncbi:MAG: hypothetical protein CSA34_04700 [Desulfobulbus propionicus]|nr:MAG: hypothetical protein CSA34_04700 [Desulfobulbus propionicus]
MNEYTACCFPGTIPAESITAPLLQVFSGVVYCAVMENDPDVIQGLSSECAALLQGGRLQLHPFAPLGNDRQRFQRLVTEISSQEPEQRKRLLALFLAGPEAGIVPGAESRHTLTSQLRQGNDDQQPAGALWQARLLLKLAELHDQEQQDIKEQLDAISDREVQVFHELLDDGDSISMLSAPLKTITSGEDRAGLRCMAWTRMLLQGASTPSHATVFITDSEDALLTLVEAGEYLGSGPASPLVRLRIPGMKGGSHEKAKQWATQRRKLFNAFLDHHLSTDSRAEVQQFEQAWHDLLPSPVSPSSDRKLTLYRFSELSRESLFRQAFDRSGPEPSTTTPVPTLVGLLHQD